MRTEILCKWHAHLRLKSNCIQMSLIASVQWLTSVCITVMRHQTQVALWTLSKIHPFFPYRAHPERLRNKSQNWRAKMGAKQWKIKPTCKSMSRSTKGSKPFRNYRRFQVKVSVQNSYTTLMLTLKTWKKMASCRNNLPSEATKANYPAVLPQSGTYLLPWLLAFYFRTEPFRISFLAFWNFLEST